MQRNCEGCGVSFTTASRRQRFCTGSCRQRAARRADGLSRRRSAPASNDLAEAVRIELTAAGRLDSVLGRMALRLAERMCGDETGSSMASLSRELRTTMAEALKDAHTAADPVEDLRTRRDLKRAG